MTSGAVAAVAIFYWLPHMHFVSVSAVLTAHAGNAAQSQLLPRVSCCRLHMRAFRWIHGDAGSCVLQTHRSGLVQAVGGDSGVITRGRFGTITLWPEAELRSLAEAAGFVLPPPAPHASGNARDARCAHARACLVWPVWLAVSCGFIVHKDGALCLCNYALSYSHAASVALTVSQQHCLEPSGLYRLIHTMCSRADVLAMRPSLLDPDQPRPVACAGWIFPRCCSATSHPPALWPALSRAPALTAPEAGRASPTASMQARWMSGTACNHKVGVDELCGCWVHFTSR